mgnify:CR=1 FL=1
MLLSLLGGGMAWFVMRVLPALRFAPPLVEVALRMERGHGDARGILAAGADMAEADAPADPITGQLAQEVVQRASAVVGQADQGIVDARPARRAAVSAAYLSTPLLVGRESLLQRVRVLQLEHPAAQSNSGCHADDIHYFSCGEKIMHGMHFFL